MQSLLASRSAPSVVAQAHQRRRPASAAPAAVAANATAIRSPAPSTPAAAANASANAAPTTTTSSRRSALLLAAAAAFALAPRPAAAREGRDPMGRYVKRKRRDPLSSYVPALLLARAQLLTSADAFGAGEPGVARALLRSGAFTGVRESVRAVAEYATDAGQDGKGLAAAFLRELEQLDLRLRRAERERDQREKKGGGGGGGGSDEDKGGGGGDKDDDKATVEIKGLEASTLAALDALVATVPREKVELAEQVVSSTGPGGGPAGAGAGGGGGGGGAGTVGGGADPLLLEGLLSPDEP